MQRGYSVARGQQSWYRDCISRSNLWLQITVTNLPFVQDDESLEDLSRDLFRLDLGSVLDNVFTEIAMLDKLHCDVDRVSVNIFKPAQEADKQIRTLDLLATDESKCLGFQATHIFQFDQRLDLLDVEVRSGYDFYRP